MLSSRTKLNRTAAIDLGNSRSDLHALADALADTSASCITAAMRAYGQMLLHGDESTLLPWPPLTRLHHHDPISID